jgi:hypothetical protein
MADLDKGGGLDLDPAPDIEPKFSEASFESELRELVSRYELNNKDLEKFDEDIEKSTKSTGNCPFCSLFGVADRGKHLKTDGHNRKKNCLKMKVLTDRLQNAPNSIDSWSGLRNLLLTPLGNGRVGLLFSIAGLNNRTRIWNDMRRNQPDNVKVWFKEFLSELEKLSERAKSESLLDERITIIIREIDDVIRELVRTPASINAQACCPPTEREDSTLNYSVVT